MLRSYCRNRSIDNRLNHYGQSVLLPQSGLVLPKKSVILTHHESGNCKVLISLRKYTEF